MFPFQDRIYSLIPSRDGRLLFIHLLNGMVFQLALDDMNLTDWIKGNFPEPCVQLDCVGEHLIGLAASGRLYCNGKEIQNAVSSFVIHSDFLLFTSVQNHRLLCTPLANLNQFSADAGCSERKVERGAKLIHAVAIGTTVVLQMPRGNLEAVHPRSLTLNILSRLIDR